VQRPDLIDPKAELSQDEYKRHLIKSDDFLKGAGAEIPAVPEPMPIMAPPPTGEDEKLISLSVTEDVPLREVFVEIARKADMDLEVDPGIKGGIIFRAKDRPFSEVINRICDLADLRCSIKDRVLKVSLDTPYIVNYPLDFLNLIRSNTGEETVNTQVLSASVSGGTGSSTGTSGTPGSTPGGSGLSSGSSNSSFTNGSKNNIKSSYEGDMWKSIEEGVRAIMANYTAPPPGISVSPSPDKDKLAAAAKPAVNGNSPDNFVTINKQAGVITVLATDKKHREVKKYLDSVRIAESAQVLIEAKVVEVNLDDEYSSGIKWDVVGKNFTSAASFNNNSLNGPSTPFFSASILPQKLFGTNTSLDSAISFTQQFGTTRTLSSPRINAMNNQQAVLTFAENSVYFIVNFSQTQTTTATTPQTFSGITSSPQVIPIGVIMTLQPSIDLDTNEITMNIRPSISSIVDHVDDPAIPLIAAQLPAASQASLANVKNAIPEVQVRELDSVLKIKSGEVMVIGGLMQEKQVGQDTGIPGLMQLPFVGNAFKATSHTTQNTETVIFIKATIVPSRGGVKDYDRDFYETYQTKRS